MAAITNANVNHNLWVKRPNNMIMEIVPGGAIMPIPMPDGRYQIASVEIPPAPPLPGAPPIVGVLVINVGQENLVFIGPEDDNNFILLSGGMHQLAAVMYNIHSIHIPPAGG